MVKVIVWMLLGALLATLPLDGKAETDGEVAITQAVDSATQSMDYRPAKRIWEASSRLHGALFGMTHVWQVYPVIVQSLDKRHKRLALVVTIKSQGKQVESGTVVCVADGASTSATTAGWGDKGLPYLWGTSSTITIPDEQLIRKMANASDVRVAVVQGASQISVKLNGSQLRTIKAMVDLYDGMEPRP